MRKGEVDLGSTTRREKNSSIARTCSFSMARGTKEDGEGRLGGIDDPTHRP